MAVLNMSCEDFPDIGPHEGRELELMLKDRKPLAMFTEVLPTDAGLIPDTDFAPYVSSGRLIMREVLEPRDKLPDDPRVICVRRVLYALPGEAWRIEAMLLACDIAGRQMKGWDEGLERMIGRLLGYDERQIDAFLSRVLSKRSS